MISRVFVGAAVFGASLALAACSQESTGKEDVGSYESELKLVSPRYLGPIASGQTISAYYYDPPKYRSFGFYANGGDTITVDVKSQEGDAMGWITDTSYNVVAANDDASSSTLDSKVTYKVPASVSSKAYRIVFRDYDLLDATFDVKLTIKAGGVSSSSGGSSGSTCDPSSEPWRNYIGTPTTCPSIRFTCAVGKRSFSNACGCGCETN
jgi:hypothetical protein